MKRLKEIRQSIAEFEFNNGQKAPAWMYKSYCRLNDALKSL